MGGGGAVQPRKQAPTTELWNVGLWELNPVLLECTSKD